MGHLGDHAHHAIVAGTDGIHQIVCNLGRHLALGAFSVFDGNVKRFLDHGIFVAEYVLPIGDAILLEGCYVLTGQCQHNLGMATDGIAHVAAFP